MKKISYFIIVLASIFIFNNVVDAETCKYARNISCDENDPHMVECMNGGNTASTPYLRMLSYAAKKYQGIEPSAFQKKIEELRNAYSDAWHQENGRISNISFTFETGSNSGTVSFEVCSDGQDFGLFEQGQIVNVKKRSGSAGYCYSLTFTNNYLPEIYSTCPDTINITYEGHDDVGPLIWAKDGKYISNNDYDIFKLINSALGNLSNAKYYPLVLFKDTLSLENGNTQNSANLLDAVYCNLTDTSTAFVTDGMEEIKEVIDKATKTQNSNYGIRNIYEQVLGFNKEQVRETLDALSSNSELKNDDLKAIADYMTTLPYFKNKTVKEALDEIRNDKKILTDHKETYMSFENCLLKAYGQSSSGNLNEAVKKYMEYDPDFQGLYIDAMINLLNLFDESNISDWLMASAEKDYVKEKFEKYQHIADSDAQKEQIRNDIKTDIAAVDCQKLADKLRNGDKLTVVEKLISDILLPKCSSKDYNCNLNKCVDAKKSDELDKKIDDLIAGNTEAQKNIGKDVKQFYSDIINHVGVTIETDLCKIFDGSLGEYITLGMNILRIAGPILVIFFTAFDGIKTIASSKEENGKKFYSKLKIRLICVALLFLVPTIVNFLIDFVYKNSCSSGVIK